MPPPIHSPADIRAIKTAFRLLVLIVGGLAAAASVTRVGMSQLADYYHPQKLDCLPPADVIADLEAVAQQPLVTAELARIARYRLVPMAHTIEGEPQHACAVACQEAAEAAVFLCNAMVDGRLDRSELVALDRLFADVEAAAHRARALIGQHTSSPAAAAACGEGQPGDRRPLGGDGTGHLSTGDAA